MNSGNYKGCRFSVKISLIWIIAVFLLAGNSTARELNVSLAFLPDILESSDNGVFVDLVKAIDDAYEEGGFNIKVYPMVRSIDNVVTGKADLHIPMIRNRVVPEDKLPFRQSTVSLGKVVFVVYSHKDRPVTARMIEDAKGKGRFPYKLEVGRGLESHFNFPLIPANKLEQSLKKVAAKRVDGLVWAQEETDHLVKTMDLRSIHREYLTEFDDIVVIPKGQKGDEIDKIISESVGKLRSSGRLAELHGKIHTAYIQWQPYQQ